MAGRRWRGGGRREGEGKVKGDVLMRSFCGVVCRSTSSIGLARTADVRARELRMRLGKNILMGWLAT